MKGFIMRVKTIHVDYVVSLKCRYRNAKTIHISDMTPYVSEKRSRRLLLNYECKNA